MVAAFDSSAVMSTVMVHHTDNSTTWTRVLGEMASVFHSELTIPGWAVALNDSSVDPNRRRFDWTYGPEGDLFYCQTAFVLQARKGPNAALLTVRI